MMQRLLAPIAIVVAAVLVVVLASQNHTLRERSANLEQRISAPYPGFIVPTVRTASLAGDSVILGETVERGGRQILLAFNTSCPYCLASLPAWRSIAAAVQASGTRTTRVYGVSLDSIAQTRAYVERHGMNYPVVLLSAKDPVLFRMQMVPVILIVDEYGRTMYARRGALETGSAMDSVLKIVRVKPTIPHLGG